MTLNYASLCDGIGAVHAAWAPLEWRCAWTSEIDPFACAVVERRWGHRNLGDMTRITKEMMDGNDQLDLVVGGTPCQSFSVAGLRKGLDDPRGNLALVFLRLVGLARPRWVLWENVPGVLSVDRGRAFGSFLGALGQLGYGFAWRVLDAQFLGVPQRRRRVFVVGHLGDWRPAAAVLLEPQGLCGDFAARRGPRAAVARAVTASAGGSIAKEQQLTFVGQDSRPLNALCFGGGNTAGEINVATCLTHHHTRQDFDTETFAVVGPLCANVGQHGHTGGGQQAVEAGHVVAHAVGPLCTRSGGHTEQQAVEAGHIVTHALTARHDSSPDGTGRDVPLVTTHQNTGRGWWNEGPVAQAVRASSGGGTLQANVVAYGAAGGGEVRREADQTSPPTTDPAAGIAYAFQPRIGRSGRGQPSEVVPALAGAGSDTGATSDSRPCVAVVGPSYAVRRLTPRECERLQGFPDDYTLIDFRGKPASDGARYRALGNSMAVPVMAWIGRRIDLADMLLEAQ